METSNKYLKYIVYITVNQCNGKIYFGYHKTNPDVWDGYIGNGIFKPNDALRKNTPFAKAVRKYGYENFQRTTIAIFPGTEEGKEQARSMEGLIVNKTLLRSKNVYNVVVGGDGGDPNIKRRVYMFDLKGNYLRSFDCAREAALYLKVDDIHSGKIAIRNNCCGKTQSSFGYFWSYKKEFTHKKHPKWKAVAQYTARGKFIRHFDSIMEAEEVLGIGTVQQAVTHGFLGGGFQWKYFEGDTSDIEPLVTTYSKNHILPIIMINKKTGEEFWYENINKCIQSNPTLNSGQINRVLKKVIKSHKGFIFKYDESQDKDMV